MPRRPNWSLLTLVIVSLVGLNRPVAVEAQVRYLSEDAAGFGVMGEYGTHLGPQMTSVQIMAQPRGQIMLGFMAATGSIETIPGPFGFSGEDPQETVYGPRVAVRVNPRSTEDAPQFLITGGWEWQEITHPDIEEVGGQLKTDGPVFGLAMYRLMNRTESRDMFLDASIERYNLTVHINNADDYMDIWDPTITFQMGMTLAFRGGRRTPRMTLVRPFARVTEWDLTFGIGVGLMWETASPY